MEILHETSEHNKKTFLSHVFSSTEEGKAEILNVVQYSVMGVIPIVILNKLIQRFIPEADPDKSTLELLVEIFIQLIVMFCGIILIHRTITYFPTYSGFKYEDLTLTNVILAFLIIIFSIQTKIGLKINILVDRLYDLWNGTSDSNSASDVKRTHVRIAQQHIPSQADFLDHSGTQSDVFPPAPMATSKPQNGSYDTMMRGSGSSSVAPDFGSYMGPAAANSVLGGSFGSAF
jgi:hypothetical protein